MARLVEPQHETTHSRPLVLVMRYEIVNVLEGTYSERELYAAHFHPRKGTVRCRDLAGKAVTRFKAGAVHHLRLDQNVDRRGPLVDLRTDKHLPRYRVTCANLVPPGSP